MSYVRETRPTVRGTRRTPLQSRSNRSHPQVDRAACLRQAPRPQAAAAALRRGSLSTFAFAHPVSPEPTDSNKYLI